MLMRKVWIVEDEPDIADLVARNLRKEQFDVKEFYDGEDFIDALKSELPDLVVLDLMLPGIDGLEICKIMRLESRTRSVPIIILTAKGTELDVVLGLELGADDYMVKPFSVRELMARIKAILRRSEETDTDNIIKFGGLTLNPESFEAKTDGEVVGLTYAEFKTLELLARKPSRVFTRQQIIDGIWDDYRLVVSKTVDVHIARLRKKIGKYGHMIKTVRGVGYKFEP
ncbi:response regulator [Candidatus Poribacteria bacterium]|nr:response regulator [Candidatus Poribacteria bacterium]